MLALWRDLKNLLLQSFYDCHTAGIFGLSEEKWLASESVVPQAGASRLLSGSQLICSAARRLVLFQ